VGVFVLCGIYNKIYIMKRIVQLTEGDLSRIVMRVIKEQTELKPNSEINSIKERIIVDNFKIYKQNSQASVKLRGSLQYFPNCAGQTVSNCFNRPSNLGDGYYTNQNYTGDLIFIYETKTYRCKLSKPCQLTSPL
jgi:hypothetical protein